MTEDEAKTKWCPRAHDGSDQRCIGSDCMAWRKSGPPMFRNRPSGKLTDRDITGNGDWVVVGYCGLAGKP